MTAFRLKIVTPDGIQYDGNAEELVVRTTTGDVGILAGHINFVAPLGMGEAMILMDGKKRRAACIGGMVSVVNETVTLLPTTFEWADEIDVARAERALERAKAKKESKTEAKDIALAELKFKRALNRINVGKK